MIKIFFSLILILAFIDAKTQVDCNSLLTEIKTMVTNAMCNKGVLDNDRYQQILYKMALNCQGKVMDEFNDWNKNVVGAGKLCPPGNEGTAKGGEKGLVNWDLNFLLGDLIEILKNGSKMDDIRNLLNNSGYKEDLEHYSKAKESGYFHKNQKTFRADVSSGVFKSISFSINQSSPILQGFNKVFDFDNAIKLEKDSYKDAPESYLYKDDYELSYYEPKAGDLYGKHTLMISMLDEFAKKKILKKLNSNKEKLEQNKIALTPASDQANNQEKSTSLENTQPKKYEPSKLVPASTLEQNSILSKINVSRQNKSIDMQIGKVPFGGQAVFTIASVKKINYFNMESSLIILTITKSKKAIEVKYAANSLGKFIYTATLFYEDGTSDDVNFIGECIE